MTTSAWWESVPLHEALLICAGQHASAAYGIEGDPEPRAASFAAARASIHAGAAVELLSKSLLAKEHPALILEKAADAVPPKRHVLELDKTAGAGPLQRLLCRHLGLNKTTEELGAGLLNDRNNAAHIGLSARGLIENVDRLGLWIHFVQAAAGLSSTDWLSATAAREQERRFNAFVLSLHEKLVAARQVFESRRRDREKATKDFEEWAAQLEREFMQAAPNEVGPDFGSEQECPACSRTGYTWGVVDDVEYEYEGPGEYSQNVIWSTYFKCPICKLELNDPESAVVLSDEWSDLRSRFDPLTP